MAVRFILGRSGTGKTSYCIDAIVDELLKPSDRPLILLVPEQATYQAEHSVLVHEGIEGFHRLNILSFNRLQFLLLGKNTATPRLSRVGRQMLVHRILREQKEHLSIFGSSASSPGLARRIAQTIGELHDYAKTPDEIETLLDQFRKEQPHGLSTLKFADINLILAEYLKCIEGRFLDPDILLARACKAVPKNDLVKNAILWVDGFAGFTEAEMAILTEFLKVVEDAYIALCIDPSRANASGAKQTEPDPADMFYPTQRTYEALCERIRQCKLDLDEPIVFVEQMRFAHCAPLAHIEKHLFGPKPALASASDAVQIVCAPNERAEVQLVARQVCRLVREKGFRYRDIAVIASDISRYQHYIEACFNDYGLPFFIDRRKPLNHHPLVELVCSALRIVTGGFSHSEVFAYLKTDLVPVERSDVDLLENYCLAFGVQSGEWQGDEEWCFVDPKTNDFDEGRINKIRTFVAKPLLDLRDKLGALADSNKTIGVQEFTKAVFDFLDSIEIAETVACWIEQAGKDKDLATVAEHEQFYNGFVDVFDELGEVFADRPMSVEDYLSILSSSFSQMTLAFIPPTLDQVLVGSIERSRHPDLKAVFLIGATQKQFPVPISSDSILTDSDRRAAESMSFQLAPSTTQCLADRRYLSYIAFTRPSEFLYISYAAVNEKGSAEQPSQFIADLSGLFDDLTEQSHASDGDIDSIYTETELLDLLSSRLGRDSLNSDGGDAAIAEILEGLCDDKDLAPLGLAVVSALEYDNKANLDADLPPVLFGTRLETSATRLGAFAACPYQHFARYILALKQRQEFKFKPLDLGAFYHHVLDALQKALSENGADFAFVDDQTLVALLNEQIQRIRNTDPFISSFSRRSPHNTFIIDSAAEVLRDCALEIAQMVRAGSFRPVLSEVAFGKAKDSVTNLGKFEILLPNGRVVSLNGKIDRLDIAEVDGKKFAIVFDYKRRAKTFKWSEYYHSLDIQLPLYMLAVRKTPDSVADIPVGSFYMPIEASPESVTIGQMDKASVKFTRKAKGIFHGDGSQKLDNQVSSGWSKFYNFSVAKEKGQYGNYDNSGALKPPEFERMLRFTERSIVRLAEDILSGKIDITPYRLNKESPCSHCDYKAVCRFDWQINDYNPLASVKKTEALEKMEPPDA